MRRLVLTAVALAALAAGAAVYVLETSPTWYERARYPPVERTTNVDSEASIWPPKSSTMRRVIST